MVNVVLDKILLQLLKYQNGYTREFSLFVQIPIQVFQVSHVYGGSFARKRKNYYSNYSILAKNMSTMVHLQRVKFYLLAML